MSRDSGMAEGQTFAQALCELAVMAEALGNHQPMEELRRIGAVQPAAVGRLISEARVVEALDKLADTVFSGIPLVGPDPDGDWLFKRGRVMREIALTRRALLSESIG